MKNDEKSNQKMKRKNEADRESCWTGFPKYGCGMDCRSCWMRTWADRWGFKSKPSNSKNDEEDREVE